VTLAADLPFVTSGTVARLLASADPAGAVMVDCEGRAQWLLAAWPRGLLTRSFAGNQAGRSLRDAFASLDPACICASVPGEWFDCDDPADLQNAREMAR